MGGFFTYSESPSQGFLGEKHLVPHKEVFTFKEPSHNLPM
jgi:hypothetical protein